MKQGLIFYFDCDRRFNLPNIAWLFDLHPQSPSFRIPLCLSHISDQIPREIAPLNGSDGLISKNEGNPELSLTRSQKEQVSILQNDFNIRPDFGP